MFIQLKLAMGNAWGSCYVDVNEIAAITPISLTSEQSRILLASGKELHCMTTPEVLAARVASLREIEIVPVFQESAIQKNVGKKVTPKMDEYAKLLVK